MAVIEAAVDMGAGAGQQPLRTHGLGEFQDKMQGISRGAAVLSVNDLAVSRTQFHSLFPSLGLRRGD